MNGRIGRYRLVRELGRGGMGVVYEARDERLDRPVAIKMIGEAASDEQARRRFRREARAAARVSHPGICQLYEIGEENGRLFIAMELLAGEPLADRIVRGPVPAAEAVPLALGILEALGALHARGIVHRDLKPSNVFLTPAAVKLLDFGLARELVPERSDTETTASVLTQAGTLLGTPHYIAPEQIQGRPVDPRADLFAVGAILFEMLAGRKAFDGRSLVEVLHAALHDQPPALSGSEAIEAIDRCIRRALAKQPEDRYPTAAEMAADLAAALARGETGSLAAVRTVTRLIALPFRVLRPDPETDFLGVGLPDAIATSLSGLGSLVVRSSLLAARLVQEIPDLDRIAAEADVDVVLTGTLLRSGDKIQARVQLVEAPAGTLLWSHAAQATVGDVFELQDDLVRRIVESLSLPLSAREDRLLHRDVPATARAYEFFLRANELSLDSKGWALARELYERCVEDDPAYAPAWARLGRVYRLLAKFIPEGASANLDRARTAFERALSLNPDLAVAHNLYAQYEVEAGRPRDAMVRLLEQVRARPADPELLAGLVHVLRYCGLLEASLAAASAARRLDPRARTSVAYTHFLLADYDRAVLTDSDEERYATGYALAAQGRVEEAVAGYREMAERGPGMNRQIADSQIAALEGRRQDVAATLEWLATSGFRDPEGLYFQARTFAFVGETAAALDLLESVISAGFTCAPAFARDPWLQPLQGDPRFAALLERAEEASRAAAAAFEAADGPRLIGLRPRPEDPARPPG